MASTTNKSSAYTPVYPTNITNGILLVENVNSIDNVILASYRALNSGDGYSVGDIIVYRQIGSNNPQYYNNNSVITPNPIDLGPLTISNNVNVTSTVLAPQAANSTLQLNTNTLLSDISNTIPTSGVIGIPSNDVITVQGIIGATPINITGNVTSALSSADVTLLNSIKQELITIDNKLVAGSAIGDVNVTNGLGNNAVNIKDGGNSITVDGTIDLVGNSLNSLSSIESKIPSNLVVTNNRLVVDNTQQVQPISGTVVANTGLIQPLTNAELRATPTTVQLTTSQLNSLLPVAANTNIATETTQLNVLNAIQGNINFNETIWTDDSGTFFARRVTQVSGVVTVNYYLPDGSVYTVGSNPRPVFTDTNKQLVSSYYTAIATKTNYTTNDNLIKTDVIDISTSNATVISSLWFNTTNQTYIPTPLLADIQLLSTDDRATAANQLLQYNEIGLKADVPASTDIGSFSIFSLLKRALQNWTSLLQRIPTLGQKTVDLSLPVTIASNQTSIPVQVTNSLTVDTSLLAKESGGNLQSVNTKLPTSLGSKLKSASLSITSPIEGLDVKLGDGINSLQLLNLTNSKPIPTALVDINGNQITSFSGGTEYTEGDVDAAITGNALLWEDTGNTLRSVSAAKPLPVNLVSSIVDTSLLAIETGGNLQAINNKLPTSLGAKNSAASLSITSPLEGLNTKITDGTNSLNLLNLINSKPIPTAIVDSNGTQITSFGGGVQYTEGDIDTTITGTAILWEDNGNVLSSVSNIKPLPVNIISGAGSGGTAIVDGNTFTPNTTSLTPIGGYVDDISTNTVTEGDAGSVRITTNRALHVNLRDANGNELSLSGGSGGGSTQYIDGTTQNTPTGTQLNWNEAGIQRATSLTKALPIQPGTGALFPITGSISNTSFGATQSGVWNITNVSGTISLPTGASTSVLQTTGNTILDSINTKTPILGQALAANSIPVVLTAAQLTALTPLSSVSLTGSLPAFAATPTFNLGTAPDLTITNTSFSSIQSGTWNINDISGTINLPTGASTSLLQSDTNNLLTTIEANTQVIGTNTSSTTDLSALLLDPNLSANVISLLKTIAVTNRQLSVNTQVWDSGTISDTTTGFDKSFTVPINVTYHILFGNIIGLTDAATIERALKIEVIHTSNDIIFSTYASTLQQANSNFTYSLSGSESILLPSKDYVHIQMPMSLILYAGQKIRFYYDNGQGNDQINVSLQIGIR